MHNAGYSVRFIWNAPNCIDLFRYNFPDSCLMGYIGTIMRVVMSDRIATLSLIGYSCITPPSPIFHIEFRITSGQGIVTCWGDSLSPVLWAICNTFSTAHLPIS